MEVTNAHGNAPVMPLDTLPEIGEYGSLEQVDTETGRTTATFLHCRITRCRVGEGMHAETTEEDIDTSPVTAIIAHLMNYEIHTKRHTYRFVLEGTRPGQSTSSLIGRLRQKALKLLFFWKKD